MKTKDYTEPRADTVLTGMVVHTQVLTQLAPFWEQGLRFGSPVYDLIATIAFKYFEQQQQAPGKHIQPAIDVWFEEHPDSNLVDDANKLLARCSSTFERQPEEINPQYVLNLAGELFNKIAFLKFLADAEADVNRGHIRQAMERVTKFRSIEIGTESRGLLLNDESELHYAYLEPPEPLIEYPEVLGEFFGDTLARDTLFAFMAPEKTGKCVSEDMEVILADGRVKTIGAIVRNQDTTPLIMLNEENMRLVQRPACQFHDNGIRSCWEVCTKSGRRVITTANHKYLTPDGWRELAWIRVGQFIAVPKRLPFFGSHSLPAEEIRLLAYLLAEGGCTSDQMTFTNTDANIIKDFEHCCDVLDIGYRRKGISHHLRRAGWFRKRYGLYKVKSTTKTIPSAVFTCPREQVALFLKVFFSCDGHISSEGDYIELTLANEKMLRQISHLLNRFGIVHKFQYKQAQCGPQQFPAWRISIASFEYVNLFLSEINFFSLKYRQPQAIVPGKSFLDRFPAVIANKFYQEMKVECHRSGQGFYARFGRKQAMALRYQINLNLPIMRKSFARGKGLVAYERFMDADMLWDEVVSIHQVGKRQTYDLAVEDYHNFVANDCFVHNTFWLLDLAIRAIEQRKRTVFFACGDMSKRQMYWRFLSRIAERPFRSPTRAWPCTINYPVAITSPPTKDAPALVRHEKRTFTGPLSERHAKKAIAKFLDNRVKSLEAYLSIQAYPARTMTVAGIRLLLQQWDQLGFTPDVVVIDYADILAPPPGTGRQDPRDQINRTWEALRALSTERGCLVATATQANAKSYGHRGALQMWHFSEDKRKLAHASVIAAITVSAEQKDQGLMGLNWVAMREGEFNPNRICHVAGCLALANPAILSTW